MVFSRKVDGRLFSRLSCGLCLFGDGWSFNLFGLFLPLRWRLREIRSGEMMESWGFSFCDRTIHLNWAHKTKVLHFPWDWEHLKHEVRCPDGTWVKFIGSWVHGESDGRWQESYPYEYELRSGEIQRRTATVFVGRREWRWRWLMWSSWPSMKRQSIDVSFDSEVGERTGSWKGGTVGCGYDMLPGESALETLRRMEKEREFK